MKIFTQIGIFVKEKTKLTLFLLSESLQNALIMFVHSEKVRSVRLNDKRSPRERAEARRARSIAHAWKNHSSSTDCSAERVNETWVIEDRQYMSTFDFSDDCVAEGVMDLSGMEDKELVPTNVVWVYPSDEAGSSAEDDFDAVRADLSDETTESEAFDTMDSPDRGGDPDKEPRDSEPPKNSPKKNRNNTKSPTKPFGKNALTPQSTYMHRSPEESTLSTADDELHEYIETLKKGSLEIQDCIRAEDSIRQDTEERLQKNIDSTQTGISSLDRLADGAKGHTGVGILANFQCTPIGIVCLPLQLLSGAFRAVLTALFYPLIFLATLFVILYMPKR